jgi:hypothetical protein
VLEEERQKYCEKLRLPKLSDMLLETGRQLVRRLGSFFWTSPQDAEKFLSPKAILFKQLAVGSGDRSEAYRP